MDLRQRLPTLTLATALALVTGTQDVSAQTRAPAIQVAVATTSPEHLAAQASAPPTQQPEAPAATPLAAPQATPSNAETSVRMFRGRPEDDLLHEMATRPVRRVIERFNSSTLVFHCDLGDGYEIAFKPARQGERDWWVHELAGYELARALGIEGRVPPAVYRTVPIGALDGFLRDANLEVERNGMVEGAAIVWMPVLRRTNLHTAEARAEWNPWLDPRQAIPPERLTRATQIASLIVFDYLQANFDRWNSANVPQDERDDLVFRDNNRAWYMQNLRRTDRGGIEGIRRIPASLLSAVERTPAEVLARRTVNSDFRILRESQVREYEVRRRALLARVNEAVEQYGRDRVVIDDSATPISRVTDRDATEPASPASPVTAEPTARRRGRHGHHHRDADGEQGARHGHHGRHGRHGRHGHHTH